MQEQYRTGPDSEYPLLEVPLYSAWNSFIVATIGE